MIEKCFKCDGQGNILVTDVDFNFKLSPGGINYKKSIACPRCLGSGAVDYRIVEAKPVTADAVISNPPRPQS